jgi:hypothetical protein
MKKNINLKKIYRMQMSEKTAKPSKNKQMGDDELKAILDSEINNSMGYIGGDLTEQRRKAMDYYLGEPFGNEVEGRSKVVSTDVSDVIEWIMPTLMKTFCATDEVVRFDPVGPEDVEAAEQETDYINHVFYKDNEGFLILYTFLKDALLQKNGIVKSFWEKDTCKKPETYEGLDDQQFLLLMQDDELEAIQHSESIEIEEMQMPDGTTQQVEVKTHDVKFMRTVEKGNAIVLNVPPEEYYITKTHNNVNPDKASFIAHRWIKTVSELREMGYDQKIIDQLPSYQVLNNEEEISRKNLNDEREMGEQNLDKSMRRIEGFECYIRVDYDGDGYAELRKVNKSGNQILDNEECDSQPFSILTPIILTHKHFGLSIADLIMDLQKIKSSIWRQILDNMYLLNNSRNAVDKDRVNLDDLLTSRPGGIVRVQGDPGTAIAPIVAQPMSQVAYQMLEYIDQVREARTGVSQSTMGMSSDMLNNNKGDASVERLLTLAEQRVELIARIFAETGIKNLFLKLHELILKHQDKERVVQLRNKWVEVDPREWRERNNMTVAVGLGTGERQRLSAAMMMMQQIQQNIVANGGLNVLVTPANVYKTTIDLMKYQGIKDPTPYIQDPNSPEAQEEIQRQKVQQQQSPDQQAMQVQMQAIQAQLENERQMNQINEQYTVLKHQREVFQLQQQNVKNQQDYSLKVQQLMDDMKKHKDDIAVKLTDLELKYSQNVPGAVV